MIKKPIHKPLTESQLFKKMYETPNPVTRAVYREMWMNLQKAKEEN